MSKRRLKEQLTHDETGYIQDKLIECEAAGNQYYVHSKSIKKDVRKLLVQAGLYVYGGEGYTYICQRMKQEEAMKQMPIKQHSLSGEVSTED